MFLQLVYTRLNVYQFSQDLAVECYKLTKLFPAEEKFAMIQQIRRAALSVHLNVAEGCSRKSKTERIRYFEIARGSMIEIDSALDIAFKLSYSTPAQLQLVGESIVKTFKLLKWNDCQNQSLNLCH